jgi:catalase
MPAVPRARPAASRPAPPRPTAHWHAAPLAAAAACFAFAAPAPAAAQVDPNRFLDAFEGAFGKYPGFRRSGAKGVCATGEFTGSAEARALSVASAFNGAPMPAIVRFSVGGANPSAADNTKSQRNMAIQLDLPGGERWQMGNISSPVFGAATPEQFVGRLESLRVDPATKMPDAAKVKAFADANPEVALIGRHFASQPVPASFATVNYWGVHAFGFADARGNGQWGKWVFEPVGGAKGLTDEEAKARGPNFLIDELRERVKAGPADFHFVLQLAEAGDRLDSAVTPLPEARRKVNLGRLRITAVAADGTGPCLAITYNPLVLPRGIEPSADPMLAGRAAPYAVGLARRIVEGPKQ